jgi:DNA-binding CsgD family transcriptional regulator
LMSALAEAARAGLIVDDGEQLRFAHDLAREATRNSLAQSLRRAMERQAASIMLSMGVGPADVATQLARTAEPGDAEAIGALRKAAQVVSHSDVSMAADYSKRALELTSVDDPEHGRLVAETVVLLNRARRYEESEELAVAALERASVDEEAEIRLRLPVFTRHSSKRRVEESRRALELGGINDVARARHMALLAYNLMLDDDDGKSRAAAADAAAAAESVGDLEAKVVAGLTLACYDSADGHASLAVDNLKELSALGRASDLPIAHLLSAVYFTNLLGTVGRLDDAAEQVASRTERARAERNEMALDIWATYGGMIHLAAGRIDAARAAVEQLPPLDAAAATELDMIRAAVLADVAVRTDDRNLLQQLVAYARVAHSSGSATVRRTAAHVLAMAAWHRNDLHDAAQWFGDDIGLLGTPLTPHALDQVILGARIAAASGDAGVRERVLRAAETLQRDDQVPLFTAVAQYASGLVDGDVDALTTAASLLSASIRPLLYAAAAEDAGAQLIIVHRTDEAVDQLNAAFDTYSDAGAVDDARRVGRQLRQLGIERRIVTTPRAKSGWDSLTESELKVIDLVAKGATNRQVADQLYLSLHTVKTHVHNAFTKLGITSRAQLATQPV